jgi:cytochrome c oxidase subunit 2
MGRELFSIRLNMLVSVRRMSGVAETLKIITPLFVCSVTVSCSGTHSPLDPAGREAADVATLFFTMLAGGIAIWIAVVALFVYAARKERVHSHGAAGKLILWGGAILPCVILAGLLSYAVWLMPNVRPWFPGGEGLRAVDVTGEQFWWRVRYRKPDGTVAFETANEVRIPVGERVAFQLTSADVIHSFWIPVLGGKIDMIPGRRNILTLEAQKTGTYRGVCAEFCGSSHALMAFTVLVMEPQDFAAWMAARQTTSGSRDPEGLALFLKHGCAACHTISGTEARGTIGPDLTAFGERGSLGAGTLPNEEEHIARFIHSPGTAKPDAHMPHFSMLPEAEIHRIAAYLRGLR